MGVYEGGSFYIKELEQKHTITMDTCYAQYSAVRRFPK